MMHAINQRSIPVRDIAMSRSVELPTRCSHCRQREHCLTAGLQNRDAARLDNVMRRRKVKAGDALYRMGDPLVALFAVRLGCFKTRQTGENGDSHIPGFQMTGDLLGLDAIATERHTCDAIALEDSEVCEIPFGRLQSLCGEMPTLLHHFHRKMSQEITREQGAMLMLGNLRASQRFATFLLDQSARASDRGYSATKLLLRMSRADIGNHLALTGESISRMLHQFKMNGWVDIKQREIELLNLPAIQLQAGSDGGD